jgi:hypothetical protein
MVQTNHKNPPLFVPQLRQEIDPTATNMRAIQNWAQTIPQPVNGSITPTIPIGRQWPANVQPNEIYDSVIGTTDGSGDLTVVFASTSNYLFNYAYGYYPGIWPGDVTGGLGMCVPVLTSSDLTQLVIRCWSTAGLLLTNTANVRVTLRVYGA